MLYPMAQSVSCVCVEIDKKMALQWHSPLPSSSPWKNKNHFGARAGSYQNRNELAELTRALMRKSMSNQ
jgi:hypothetical protein